MKRRLQKADMIQMAPSHILWPVEELQPHPRQLELLDDLPEAQFRELVQSIRRDGIQIPLEICTDGTVICGHQRRLAAKSLGLKEVPVVVRADLEARGEKSILERMITDNTVRRQMDLLSTARSYRALKESFKSHEDRPEWLRGDVRDWLAEWFGCSGRTLDRLERLLDLPRPVQTSVSNRSLSVDLASHLFGVDEAVRMEAARRIAAGESAVAVVREVAPRRHHRLERPTMAFDRFLRAIDRANADLDGKTDKVAVYDEEYRSRLHDGLELINRLLEDVQQAD